MILVSVANVTWRYMICFWNIYQIFEDGTKIEEGQREQGITGDPH